MEVINKKTRSLRLDLSLVISGIIIALVAILCAISFFLSFNSIKKVYIEQLKGVNEEISQQVESFYTEHEAYAEFFADTNFVLEASKSGDYSEVGLIFKNFYDKTGSLENIFISSAVTDTEILVDGTNSAVGFHWGGGNFDTNITNALAGKSWISQAYPSPVTGLPVVLITAPIMDQGIVIGIFGLPFDLGVLSAQLIEGNTIGKTGYPYVTTLDGVVLAHPNPDNIFTLNLNDFDWGRELLNSKSGSLMEYIFQDKVKYQTFVKNDTYGFICAATIYESDISEDAWSMAYIMFSVGIIGIIFLIIVTLIFMYIRLKPLTLIVTATNRMAEGELNITLEKSKKKVVDETGQLLDSFIGMLESLKYKAKIVDNIASSNLTDEVKTASEKDSLGRSLIKMSDSLNDLLGQVNMSVDQVNIGADQVSQASQSLSQGATEQAASLEEISASLTQINSQSNQNADNALEANAIARKASEDAEKGNKQMSQLTDAMSRINASSDQIKKIVKVIDDIAFQTNLLALNANVEAARAGKYGKGFAVVADEVRNLAVRSAEAVKETTQMVDDSIKNIEAGNKATELTAQQLESIMDGSSRVSDFLEEISVASKEQAQAIDQITQGLDQIDQITQSNTASAEESAAASEELASQSVHLKNMVSIFKLKQGKNTVLNGQKQISNRSPSDKKGIRTLSNVDPSTVIALDDDDFDRF
jgi:methyl-accepting chemotaxis protein/type II secretory pathway pseudopilin PulG